MARPLKTGLTYFPLDVDFVQDEKVSLVIAMHGMEGLGVLISLMSNLYRKSYFYNWTEREQIIFSSNVKVDLEKVIAIVNDAIKWGFFHKGMYEEFQILTSKGFQDRYLVVTERRKGCEIKEEYKLVNTTKTIVNVNNNPVKEVKKSTEKPVKETETPSIAKDIIEYLNMKTGKNFRLSSEKTKRLINARINEKYTLDDFKKVIDTKVSQWANNPNMQKYLRPETIFSNKFEGYLNEVVSAKKNVLEGLNLDD